MFSLGNSCMNVTQMYNCVNFGFVRYHWRAFDVHFGVELCKINKYTCYNMISCLFTLGNNGIDLAQTGGHLALTHLGLVKCQTLKIYI